MKRSFGEWARRSTAVVLVAWGSIFLVGCGESSAAREPAGYPQGGESYRSTTPSPQRGVANVTPGSMRRSQLSGTAAGDSSEEDVRAAGKAEPLPPSVAGQYDDSASRPLMPQPQAAPPPPPPPPDNDHDGIPDQMDKAPDEPDARVASNGAVPGPANGKQATASEAHDPGFIIYTAKITLAVYQVEKALDRVEAIAKINGGYLSNRTDNEVTIRVPRARFQTAITDVESTGDVLHRDVRAEDVTDEYTDLEIRIRNARAMRDRLTALLQKADVKNALEIEKELGRVTEELERMEGRIKLLSDKISYSTITATYSGRGASILTTSTRLPFPWLMQLGLPGLLQLHEDR